jgi:hypothetical protein
VQDTFKKIEGWGMKIGGAGVLALVASYFAWGDHFYRSYLYGYLVWIMLTLGCLAIVLLHHLVSGAWGHIIQRMAESGARTLGVMALLFIPVLIGMRDLYPWTDSAAVEASHVLHEKAGYLNIVFFILRSAVYFAIWTGIAMLLRSWSMKQDANGDPSLTRRMKIFSGPAMVVFVVTATLASVDWMMSLEPEWYSTIYGMSFVVGSVLTALAVCIIVLAKVSDREPFSAILTSRHTHHLGNLLFAFTILWAYLAFSQYLIIWSGNLPEDNFWYLRRTGPGWNAVAVVLLIGHFFVPFFIMLSRRSKRKIGNLLGIAVLIFVMRFVDVYWLVAPAFDHVSISVHPLDVIAPVAIGGIWVALFMRNLKNVPILPLHDPRFGEDGFHIHDID